MLAAAVLAAAINTYEYSSPRNPCKIRTNGTCYRNDPYRANVVPSPYKIMTPSTQERRERIVEMETQFAVMQQQVQQQASAAAAPAPAAADVHPLFANSSLSNSDASAASSASPAPSTVSTTIPPNERCIIVEFKHETCMYRAPFRVAVGDIVVVEADRGENTGRVVEICTQAPNYDVPSKVIRRGTPDDILALNNLRTHESQVTVNVQRVSESVGLGIRVVDTEFQTDMNKLTVYYSARAPVDFRKLQRTLFRDYRCRIWIVNWSEVEFRKKQADRCLSVSICSKLGSRLNGSHAAAGAPSAAASAAPLSGGAAPRRGSRQSTRSL